MINAILSVSEVALTAQEIADRIILQFGHQITARQVYDCIYHIPKNLCLIEIVGILPNDTNYTININQTLITNETSYPPHTIITA